MRNSARTLDYRRIDTGEWSHFVFGDVSVLKQNLEIKYGALMPGANPPACVDAAGRVCFDPERVTDVHFTEE